MLAAATKEEMMTFRASKLAEYISVIAILLCATPPIAAAETGDAREARIAEMAQTRADELIWELGPFLSSWAAREQGVSNWRELPFSGSTLHDQAEAVIDVIEANHQRNAAYFDQPLPEVQAVLLAALAIAKPYDPGYPR